MARKKKLSRKEQKQLEEQRKAEIRQRQGWELDNEPHHNTIEGILPILGETEAESLDNMMQAVFESHELVDEAEFEEILWSPFESLERFMEVSEQQGWSPEAMAELDEEELDEAHDEILEVLIPELLTKEIKDEILERLGVLHGRLQKEGQLQKSAQAAINLQRIASWFMGDLPKGTRISPFAALVSPL